jgi:hypothetical protein
MLCYRLKMDYKESLHDSDLHNHHVTKWLDGQIVAVGNGHAHVFIQLSILFHVSVDKVRPVFVADNFNECYVFRRKHN